MANSTKSRIIEDAIVLFNEDGYDKISLRDIAEMAGTTIGNLTYHFHHKEDLLIAIQQKIELDFINFADSSSKTGSSALNELLNIFEKSAELKAKNKFFFLDFDSIISDNPAVQRSVQQFRKRLYNAYRQCFIKLVKFGMFRNDITDQQYSDLIVVLLTMDYAWELRNSPKSEFNPSVNTAKISVNIIYPYLTEEGRKVWDRRI